jgi:hypothetical protein
MSSMRVEASVHVEGNETLRQPCNAPSFAGMPHDKLTQILPQSTRRQRWSRCHFVARVQGPSAVPFIRLVWYRLGPPPVSPLTSNIPNHLRLPFPYFRWLALAPRTAREYPFNMSGLRHGLIMHDRPSSCGSSAASCSCTSCACSGCKRQ